MSNFNIRNFGKQFDIILKNFKSKELEELKKLNGSAIPENTGINSNEAALNFGQTQDDDILFIPVDDLDLDNINSFLDNEYAKEDGTVYDYNEALANYSKNANADINNLFSRNEFEDANVLEANNFVSQLKDPQSSLINPDIFQDFNKIGGDISFEQQMPKENETFKSLSDSQKQKIIDFIMTTSNTSEVNAAKMLVELNENDLKQLIKQLGIEEDKIAS